jgi:hypothetical protein
MTTTPLTAAEGFLDAVVARDFGAARERLHPEIDFRAMTPSRIWEADGPAEIEQILRGWLADPDEEIHAIEPIAGTTIEDTARFGWLVHGSDADGPFTFEQLAYVRERDGQIAWLRVMCSGPRPPQA